MYTDNTLAINSFNSINTDRLKSSAKQDKLLKEQTDAFESFLVKEVLDIALKEDEKSSIFPKSAGSDIYKSMYNDTMSKALSGGLGFSELLFNFLKERS
ncbi:rod-binding protein [Campylobacter pinnipediorum subsp. pinnipediorum]|uniref:Rod-binding protein n=1 Tax=Campylobacter pinnipediorum subsp. pinnipediorum TaxID=1660067 RepID=A0AAX0LBT6_9BACT|nr:rod-binding protein [Campylobacter pinnipediorum]OPA81864.1 rod-binding protein [Campylobacter pinnipediorum subsp. pinnipediorum]